MPVPSRSGASAASSPDKTPAPEDGAPKPPPFLVTNVKPRLIEIAGHRIKPTETVEIPPEHVEGVKKSPPFLARWLVEGTPTLPASAPTDITKLDETRAIKLVGIETELSVLSSWADTEQRPAVVNAIRERVKLL